MTSTQLLPRLHVGAPLHSGALTMFPLWTEHPEEPPAYRPADENGAGVTISELPQPTVPQLAIDNAAEVPVLVLEGELVAGGLQHRVLNVTVLLPAAQQTVVPVSCVEQGRWGSHDTSRLAGRHSPPSVRRHKTASVTAAMRAGRGRRSDQGAVWDQVAEQATRHAAAPPTGSLLGVDDQIQTTVEEVTRALHPLPGQRGMIVGIGGTVRALELFDSAAMFEHYFRRLVDGFAGEAVGAPPVATPSSAARKFVRSLQHLEVHESPAVGLGSEISARDEHFAALGLRIPDRPTPVHLAAFAA